MSQDKEQEIRRQFLDEAQEYLEALDTAVMGLAGGRIDIQRVNAALRAAHSIKGGAGMMGYPVLSDLAHRLEDSFKVLKTQTQSLDVDAHLENLLLDGVNCLRTVIQQHQHDQPIDPNWLEWQVEPLFTELHDRLGDPQDENAASVLATDGGQDILPVLFETEVESGLQRLEASLEQPAAELSALVLELAQELGGLAEMLDLPPFSQLCAQVEAAIAATPDQATAIATAALNAWRKSQALVLTSQLDLLPCQLEGDFASVDLGAIADAPVADISVPAAFAAPLTLDPDADTWTETPAWDDTAWDDTAWDTAWEHATQPAASAADLDWASAEVGPEVGAVSNTEPAANFTAPLPSADWVADLEAEALIDDERIWDQPADPVMAPAEVDLPEVDENATVRVSVRQLNQLNDLFGELTIQRNGLTLYHKRLRGLSQLLAQRLRVLEQANSELRMMYDRITLNAAEAPKFTGTGTTASITSASENSGYAPTLTTLISVAGDGYRFDSLEMDRYSDLHLLSQQVMETIVQIQEVSSDIDLSLYDTEQSTRELNKSAKQLQSGLNQIRMRPLSDVVNRFPRAVRELCLQHNKKANVALQGGNTLIERSLLEALNDPLMHLLRNAFDHGIEAPEARQAKGKPETGTIEISATHQGNRTLITIRDDGNGIPLDKVRAKAEQMGLDPTLLATASEQDLLSLIFEPGFSTSDRVTALSGRGVGMDVVRDSLRKVRGDVSVETKAGVGTTFTLSVPMTLSVLQVTLAECNGMLLAFPSDAIQDAVLVSDLKAHAETDLDAEWMPVAVEEVIPHWQGQPTQLIDLADWLSFNAPRQPHTLETAANLDGAAALMLAQGDRSLGLQVERCWLEQEVTIRRPEAGLKMPPGFTGCAIIADGRVVPLVNVADLLRWMATRRQQAQQPNRDAVTAQSMQPMDLAAVDLGSDPCGICEAERAAELAAELSDTLPDPANTILIVDDSINIRRFLALTLEKAGFRVEQAKDGQDALEKLQRGLLVQAVICDIEMPRLDGYGFLAKFKSNPGLADIPVAMLTSRSGDKHRQLAINLGASAYFSKPYNEQVLLRTLTEMVN
jgi:two-component system, chemotaxis family, sensor histidine kinase and response regulator PixL